MNPAQPPVPFFPPRSRPVMPPAAVLGAKARPQQPVRSALPPLSPPPALPARLAPQAVSIQARAVHVPPGALQRQRVAFPPPFVPGHAAPAWRQPLRQTGQQPVQMFGALSFNGASPFRTLANLAMDRSWESFKDIWDVRRWRLNPMNIIAGRQNGREESSGGSYHTSSRHGAHNTTGNSRARLSSKMLNQYTGASVVAPKGKKLPQGRFNSEAWEAFSWRKAKEKFAAHAVALMPVTWHASEPAARTASGVVVPLPPKQNCAFTLRHVGSDVGISQTSTGDVSISAVKVAINYFVHGGTVYAWNGQMYPYAAPTGVATITPTLHGSVLDIPYERF